MKPNKADGKRKKYKTSLLPEINENGTFSSRKLTFLT